MGVAKLNVTHGVVPASGAPILDEAEDLLAYRSSSMRHLIRSGRTVRHTVEVPPRPPAYLQANSQYGELSHAVGPMEAHLLWIVCLS